MTPHRLRRVGTRLGPRRVADPRATTRRTPGLEAAAVGAAFALLAAPALGAGTEEDPFGLGAGTEPFASPAPLSLRIHEGQDAVTPGGEAKLAVVLDLDEHWHVNAHQPLEEWLIGTELTLTAPGGIEILEVVYPEAVELSFDFSETPMAVYERNAAIGVRFRVPDGIGDAGVRVEGSLYYQACNDQTCLPPTDEMFVATFASAASAADISHSEHRIFEEISFAPDGALAAAGTEGVAAAGVVSPPPENERGVTAWLTRTIEGNFANPLVAGLLTLVAGLLSAATPCVYPMIPITARILLGRGGDNPALGRAHAGMYFVGIILIYAMLGLVASATGGGFNELMRIPAVIFAFALLFALLGLSMFGLFEIQLPSSVATNIDGATSKRAGLLGTMFMGLGAGLVVSPCVGPVVFAILAQIANQIATADAAGGGALTKSGQLAYGSVLMGAYGAGLGVPFLIVGLFSARALMAKPGRWMIYARVALGIIILYFAFDYFHKSLATAGVERGIANAILAGVVLTFLSVLWGVFRPNVEPGPHAGWHKVKHAGTILMLVVGIFYLWTGLGRSGLVAGGATASQPGALVASGITPAIEDSHGLTWHRDFAAAREEARAASLPVFVDFYAHWCANCKVFSANAAKEGRLRDALESVVRAKIYDTDPVFATFKSDPRYGELGRGLPFFLLLSSGGDFLWKGTDYRAEETMIREIGAAIARERAQASRAADAETFRAENVRHR